MNFTSAMVTEQTFKVKDITAFRIEMARLRIPKLEVSLTDLSYSVEEDGKIWLGGYDADLQYFNEETQDYEDVVPIIQKHMAEGEACVVQGAGSEGLRYVAGWVAVITPTKVVTKNLNDVTKELKAVA